MKKNFIILGSLFLPFALFSQVGINTSEPKATLDIVASATDVNKIDGVIPPRITGDQLKAKNSLYGINQNGTIVYVTEVPTASSPKTDNIKASGYYYYYQPTSTDGVWIAFKENMEWKINGNSNTDEATNFIGTTDKKSLVFRTNNTEKLRLTTSGMLQTNSVKKNLFINAGTDSETLDINATENTIISGELTFNQNTTGGRNTALGYNVLKNNTTGSANTAIGDTTLSVNTTGNYNTAVGSGALRNNSTGLENTAIGNLSLVNNTSGYRNIGLGSYSLNQNRTGFSNLAIGYYALRQNLAGGQNIAIGNYSLENTTNSKNIAIGNLSLLYNTTGQYNLAIGDGAGGFTDSIGSNYRPNTTESYNIFIGQNTYLPLAVVGKNNNLNIGNIIFGNNMVGSTENPSGNIGIGVNNPKTKLDVGGSIKIASSETNYISADGTTPIPEGGAGTIVFQNGHFYGWNGTVWKQLDN